VYVLASSPEPSAAACNVSRISPVARETTVPTIISADELTLLFFVPSTM
jgi:hypothetical protein